MYFRVCNVQAPIKIVKDAYFFFRVSTILLNVAHLLFAYIKLSVKQ